MSIFYCIYFTWRGRSQYLYPPGTVWPSYTPIPTVWEVCPNFQVRNITEGSGAHSDACHTRMNHSFRCSYATVYSTDLPSHIYRVAFILCNSGLQLGVRVPPWLCRDISGGKRKYLTSIDTKHRNRLNLEPALILALTKIRPPIEVLACQKQAQLSH
jgi:hypothetical protein